MAQFKTTRLLAHLGVGGDYGTLTATIEVACQRFEAAVINDRRDAAIVEV